TSWLSESSEKSADKGLAEARGVIDPSQGQAKTEQLQEQERNRPKKLSSARPIRTRRSPPPPTPPREAIVVVIIVGGRALCIKGSAGGRPKLPEGTETGRKCVNC
ncbi:hypothetical protein SLA2020_415770, partial [Shorea laevis]